MVSRPSSPRWRASHQPCSKTLLCSMIAHVRGERLDQLTGVEHDPGELGASARLDARRRVASSVARGRVAISGLTMTYELKDRAVTALSDFSLDAEPGEFVSIVGPSGCGKSTVIRLLAGLEIPTRGSVTIDARPPRELAAAHELGVAFQDHALLPWLTAAGNVALPFRVARKPVDSHRVQDLLRLVGIEDFSGSRPRELSGGMRQRVSIARTLALDPIVLLLDEPFGALDAVTRRRMNIELQRIWQERQVTTIFVTHSVEEATFLADRVIVLSGRPGRTVHEEEIAFPRPRPGELLTDPRLHETADRLLRALEFGGWEQAGM
jgi:NitT/TauT family transport system ATP-binding protein